MNQFVGRILRSVLLVVECSVVLWVDLYCIYSMSISVILSLSRCSRVNVYRHHPLNIYACGYHYDISISVRKFVVGDHMLQAGRMKGQAGRQATHHPPSSSAPHPHPPASPDPAPPATRAPSARASPLLSPSPSSPRPPHGCPDPNSNSQQPPPNPRRQQDSRNPSAP